MSESGEVRPSISFFPFLQKSFRFSRHGEHQSSEDYDPTHRTFSSQFLLLHFIVAFLSFFCVFHLYILFLFQLMLVRLQNLIFRFLQSVSSFSASFCSWFFIVKLMFSISDFIHEIFTLQIYTESSDSDMAF